MYRHVSGIDGIAIKKYHQRRRNEDTVEISYRHIPAIGSPNADFNQQDNEEAAKISPRQAHPRSCSRADNHLSNIESSESRIRDSYRHVEGVRRKTTARFEDHYLRRSNEGGDLHPGPSSSREHFSYQVYYSTSRPARYRESNDNSPRGQFQRSETAPLPSSRQNNNPWLRDTSRSYSYQGGDSRGEEITSFSYRQQAHHPKASLETPYHYFPRAANPHQDQGPYHSYRSACSEEEEDTPGRYRRGNIQERPTIYPPSRHTSQGGEWKTSAPSYQREQHRTGSHSHHFQTDTREKETSDYYHPGLLRRPASRARARQVHQRDLKSKSSRHVHSEEEEEEDTYHSVRHPREEKSYSSRHGNLEEEEEDTYRSARHPRKEKSYSSHHDRSEEKDTYRSCHTREETPNNPSSYGRSEEEEDTYRSRHTRPREDNTHYPRQVHSREENFHHRHQGHSKEKNTYNDHQANSGGEEDSYYGSPSYSQDSETNYARPSYARDSETSSYSEAHARKKEASHTHKAPRQEDQDRSKRRQAHSGAKESSNTYREEIKPSPPRQPEQKLVGDLYKSLKVSPEASHDEIVHAARKRRIEVHPDRRKLPGMSPSDVSRINMEAQEVGLAADTLCDEASREKYDRALRRGSKT